MKKAQSQIGEQCGFLGLLNCYWNELHARTLSVLVMLSPDPLTALMLTADYQIGNVINSTRMMARERKQLGDRINAQLRKKRFKTKLYGPFFEHVEHFLNWVDILREYRDYYIHNTVFHRTKEHVQIQKVSAKGAVWFHFDDVLTEDLQDLAKQINECLIYADRLLAALEKNESHKLSSRPTWPRKPPLPERLKTSRTILQDVVPQLQSSPTLFRSRFQRRLRGLERERLSEKKRYRSQGPPSRLASRPSLTRQRRLDVKGSGHPRLLRPELKTWMPAT
jgi:hypothetical protein